MIKVKICGIHSSKEANEAIKAGADYLGLLVNIPKTNLSLDMRQAKEIVYKEKNAKFIVLTLETDYLKLYKLVKAVSPWGIQLLKPNLKSVVYLKKRTHVNIIPVIHITALKSIIKARKYYNTANFLLLDSKKGRHLGGTGKVHNWKISKRIIKESPIPIFIAGGLNVSNVKMAIKYLDPYCIDVESSLRNARGFRDIKKLNDFIKKVKN